MITTIFILILALFIGANALCGCCKYPIFDMIMGKKPSCSVKEGIDSNDVGQPGSVDSKKKALSDITEMNNLKDVLPSAVIAAAANPTGGSDAPPREETITSKEGMTTIGASLDETPNGDLASSWISKATTFASEFGYGDINNTGTAYTGTPVPLPEDEMVIFSQNKFKPECCPSPYSTSSGCVCITPEQINYLNTRGGNRTSDSEF
jgi:hypothetical protein